jgi:hypothetical protein
VALKLLYVVCACGAPVDTVEYDDATASTAVTAVMEALGWDEQKARRMVGEQNPGAELTGEEQARGLADKIRRREVEDRDAETYRCGQGHYDTELSVTDQRPAPVPVSIVQTPANVAGRLAGLEANREETR